MLIGLVSYIFSSLISEVPDQLGLVVVFVRWFRSQIVSYYQMNLMVFGKVSISWIGWDLYDR